MYITVNDISNESTVYIAHNTNLFTTCHARSITQAVQLTWTVNKEKVKSSVIQTEPTAEIMKVHSMTNITTQATAYTGNVTCTVTDEASSLTREATVQYITYGNYFVCACVFNKGIFAEISQLSYVLYSSIDVLHISR